METSQKKIFVGIGAVALLAVGYGAYYVYADMQDRIATADEKLAVAEAQLAEKETENEELEDELRFQENRVDDLEEQIEELTGTLGTLEKLSKTDPELLQKYSKVFFLNEHYSPPRLSTISTKYVLAGREPQQIHRDVKEHLDDLLDDADDDDIALKIVSAYRSFGTQSTLKTGYTVTYGSGANTFSADQGYSEHQLGTTVDFTAPEENPTPFVGFENTEAYQWLLDNAHRYGFVLSYPQGNAYYVFEPWHWRFVGVDLARELHKKGIGFYDMDQREIDKHLVEIFD